MLFHLEMRALLSVEVPRGFILKYLGLMPSFDFMLILCSWITFFQVSSIVESVRSFRTRSIEAKLNFKSSSFFRIFIFFKA